MIIKKRLQKFSYRNVLYIGIVNIEDKKNVNMPKMPNATNIKIIILGISKMLFGRNMFKSLEWKDINDLKELKKYIKEVKTKFNAILGLFKKSSI